jgi:hypothetical protein
MQSASERGMAMNTVEEYVPAIEEKRTTVKTTLYDLIAAMQETVEPSEDALVVGTVVHLLRTGRIRFLGDTSSLN